MSVASFIAVKVERPTDEKKQDYAETKILLYMAVPSFGERCDIRFLVRTILRIDPGQLERAVRLI